MKKVFVAILFIVAFCSSLKSQDIITLKNGDEINSKVTEVTATEIKYKKADNIDGPTYTLNKSEVFFIKYANGTKEIFNKVEDSPKKKNVAKSEPVEQSYAEAHVNEKGKSSVNFDVGLISTFEFDDTYEWKTYGFGFSYLYSASKVFNIGLEAYISSLTSKTLYGTSYDYYTGAPSSYAYTYEITAFTLYLKSQFFWLNNPRFGLYSGLDIGYLSGTSTTKFDYGYGYPGDLELIHGAAQVTAVGCKFLSKGGHWISNAELGIGKRGIINIGFGYQF